MAKKLSFWARFRPIRPKFEPQNFFFQNLAASFTRYHDQVSSCKISEKTDDPILGKFRQTERQMDRQSDESDFIRCCANEVERSMFRSRDI